MTIQRRGGSAQGRKAAADRTNDGAARSTLLWAAERYEQLAEMAEGFRGPGKLLELEPKARGRQRATASVGKSDCERTFARATGNDQVAPQAAIREGAH
jgi:hypothetical protein